MIIFYKIKLIITIIIMCAVCWVNENIFVEKYNENNITETCVISTIHITRNSQLSGYI